MNTITQGRQQLLVAMVAGSLCVLFGHLGNFASSQAPARYIADISAHHTRFVASELVVAISAFLLIPAMAGLMRLAPARGGRFTTVGGIFAGIALAGLGAGNLMFGAALESQNSTPASASAAATAPSIPPPGTGHNGNPAGRARHGTGRRNARMRDTRDVLARAAVVGPWCRRTSLPSVGATRIVRG